MMLLTRDELRGLTAVRNGYCVSIYIPTVRAGAEVEQNRLRFKNGVAEARDQLVAAGVRSPDARQLLQKADALVEDNLFWQYQADGLAAFAAAGYFRTFRLPLEFEQLITVSDRFHVKPLMPLLSGDGRYYILAFSQNKVRLFQGTRFSVAEVKLEEAPDSLADALRYDDPEKRLQWHTATDAPGGAAMRWGSHHAHTPADEERSRILRFLHKLDRGVASLIARETAPLLLAGVEYLFPIYHEANTYSHLLEDGISGNPDELKAEELQRMAWEIVAPHFEKEREKVVEAYLHLKGNNSERASDDLREIVAAAHFERVEHLFVPLNVELWGDFDSETGRVRVRDEREVGDDDLLDLAAAQTLDHGGMVYAVDPTDVPGDGVVAAIFRY
jgi:hypothetical protein